MVIDWYEEITNFYPNQWDIDRVKIAVEKGKITEEQYKEIIGEDYIAIEKIVIEPIV